MRRETRAFWLFRRSRKLHFLFLTNKWAHRLFYSLYSVQMLAYWAFNLGKKFNLISAVNMGRREYLCRICSRFQRKTKGIFVLINTLKPSNRRLDASRTTQAVHIGWSICQTKVIWSISLPGTPKFEQHKRFHQESRCCAILLRENHVAKSYYS